MWEIYGIWCFVAFGIWCIQFLIKICLAIFRKTRIETNNYHKVLMFYNFSNAKFEKWEPHFIRNILRSICLNFIIWTALSRLTVLYTIVSVIIVIVAKIKVKKLVDKKTISKVKELQLKIRYIDLSEKDMKKYLKEIDDLLWIEEKSSIDEEENWEIILQDDDWFRSVTINDNTLYRESHPSDWTSEHYWIDEYKIKWTKVLIRTIESKNKWLAMGEYYEIKDGVVLESEILWQVDSKISKFVEHMTKDTIEKCKKAVKWHELWWFVWAIVLKRNISKPDFKKYVTWEIERLNLWKLKVEKLCEKYWINFVYKEEYWWYYDIDREQISKDKKWTMKKVHEFNKELEEEMNNCNCTYEEVQTFSVYKKQLEDLVESD